MKMRNDVLSSRPIFRSAKCQVPVPCAGGLLRDLLVQLSLDPKVGSISYIGDASIGPETVELRMVTVARTDGRFALDFEPTRPLRSLGDHDRASAVINRLGYAIETVEAAEVMAEPRFSTSRAVWAHRRIKVPLRMRLAFAGVLSEAPTVTLDDLCREVSGPQDPFGAILALVCENVLELDLSRPLGPQAIVRAR